MTNGKIVKFKAAEIRIEDRKVNLTDMWKAAGADPARRPVEWRRLEGPKALFAALNEVGGTHFIISAAKGTKGASGGGATWGCEEVAIKYAMYLSTEFELWALTTLRNVLRDAAKSKDWSEPGAYMRMLLLAPGTKRPHSTMFGHDYVKALNHAYRILPGWKGGVHPRYLGRIQQWLYPLILGSDVYREMKARTPHPAGSTCLHLDIKEEHTPLFRECIRSVTDIAETSTDRRDFRIRVTKKFAGGMHQVALLGVGEQP